MPRNLNGRWDSGRREAFTLIEVLLVASIIVLLTAGVGMALRDNSAHSIRHGQQLVARMLEEARLIARTRSVNVRLGIHADPGRNGIFQRLQLDQGSPGEPDRWQPIAGPAFLPERVCVVSSSVAPEPAFASTQAAGAGEAWYLEFDSRGRLVSDHDGAAVIILRQVRSARQGTSGIGTRRGSRGVSVDVSGIITLLDHRPEEAAP